MSESRQILKTIGEIAVMALCLFIVCGGLAFLAVWHD